MWAAPSWINWVTSLWKHREDMFLYLFIFQCLISHVLTFIWFDDEINLWKIEVTSQNIGLLTFLLITSYDDIHSLFMTYRRYITHFLSCSPLFSQYVVSLGCKILILSYHNKLGISNRLNSIFLTCWKESINQKVPHIAGLLSAVTMATTPHATHVTIDGGKVCRVVWLPWRQLYPRCNSRITWRSVQECGKAG